VPELTPAMSVKREVPGKDDAMRKVKIFKSIESELWSMEEEINSWVEESGANIVDIAGNIAPQSDKGAGQGFSASDVLIVVTYEPA
jgi:hypothetical protein